MTAEHSHDDDKRTDADGHDHGRGGHAGHDHTAGANENRSRLRWH